MTMAEKRTCRFETPDGLCGWKKCKDGRDAKFGDPYLPCKNKKNCKKRRKVV